MDNYYLLQNLIEKKSYKCIGSSLDLFYYLKCIDGFPNNRSLCSLMSRSNIYYSYSEDQYLVETVICNPPSNKDLLAEIKNKFRNKNGYIKSLACSGYIIKDYIIEDEEIINKYIILVFCLNNNLILEKKKNHE